MGKSRLIITGRIEEIPTIGQFTIQALNNCLTALSVYKPGKYVPAFITALVTKMDAVGQIVYPVIITSELKVITIRLMNNVIGLRLTMNLLEGYVADATGLTVEKADFGFKAVRKSLYSFDVEGLNTALATLLINITNNMAALETAGYTAAMKTDLEGTKVSIFKDNGKQNELMETRAQLVVTNIAKINDFLVDIKGIWADGKRLYGLTDKVKAKMFSNADIIRRIRNDELHTIITGTVYDKAGNPSAGAKIVARPSSEGKRGKTVKSDANGKYELKGLKPFNFILTVTLKTGGIFATNVDAVTNQTVVMNLKEPV